MSRLLGAILLSLGISLGALYSPPANSHPHAWIDLNVTAVFDEQGRLVGLRQSWLMDPFYSIFLLEEMADFAQGETREQQLNSIAQQILENLTPYGYFTELRYNSDSLEGSKGQEATLEAHGRRLELTFFMAFAEPLDLFEAALEYAVFDPTYYVEVLHTKNSAIHLQGGLESCEVKLTQPRPDPALVARAAALDYDETGDPMMGRHFAEWVRIQCAP